MVKRLPMASSLICSVLVPTKSDIEEKVPEADQDNRDEIRQIHIQVKPIDLDVQQEHAPNNAREANQIELQETNQPCPPVVSSRRQATKSPNIIPDKIIENADLCREDFAQAKVPTQ